MWIEVMMHDDKTLRFDLFCFDLFCFYLKCCIQTATTLDGVRRPSGGHIWKWALEMLPDQLLIKLVTVMKACLINQQQRYRHFLTRIPFSFQTFSGIINNQAFTFFYFTKLNVHFVQMRCLGTLMTEEMIGLIRSWFRPLYPNET